MSVPPIDRRRIPDVARIARWQAEDGWDHRALRWPAAGVAKGTILFMGGRGDFFEKYFEAMAHWHRAGWCVESFDWRGQGGSGRQAVRADVGHADRFDRWTRDIGEYAADIPFRAPGPLVVIGHSMGGHLVLRALAERRIAPDAAVLVAPMLGFSGDMPLWLGRTVARVAIALRGPQQRMWKVSEKPFSPMAKRMGLLTHSPERYADEQYFWDTQPELKLGPASWGWIAAAYESFSWLAKAGRLEGVTVPLLILSAAADKLVSPKATAQAAKRLPNARLVAFGPESAHELLRECDPVRSRALGEIDRLLDEVIAAR